MTNGSKTPTLAIAYLAYRARVFYDFFGNLCSLIVSERRCELNCHSFCDVSFCSLP